MLVGIPQRLARNPVNLISYDRMQRPYGSLHSKRSCMICGPLRSKVVAERFDGGDQIVGLLCRCAQTLHGLPSLGDRASRLLDRTRKDFLGLRRSSRQQIRDCLESK